VSVFDAQLESPRITSFDSFWHQYLLFNIWNEWMNIQTAIDDTRKTCGKYYLMSSIWNNLGEPLLCMGYLGITSFNFCDNDWHRYMYFKIWFELFKMLYVANTTWWVVFEITWGNLFFACVTSESLSLTLISIMVQIYIYFMSRLKIFEIPEISTI
jgi:hypothetical protein